eukprot:COSAG03_NODE_5938_length_1144_cov_24.340670_3_plen_51_part_00
MMTAKEWRRTRLRQGTGTGRRLSKGIMQLHFKWQPDNTALLETAKTASSC